MSENVVLGFGVGFVVEMTIASVLSLEGVNGIDVKVVLRQPAFRNVGRGILKNDI